MSKDLVYPLPPNKFCRGFPLKILAVDTETVPSDQGNPMGARSDLQFGSWRFAHRGDHHAEWVKDAPHEFWETGEFWDYAVTCVRPEQRRTTTRNQKAAPLWIVAHNMAGFDFDVLGAEAMLLARGFEIVQKIVGDPYPFKMVFQNVKDPTRRIIVADSMNWFRTSLAMIGDSIGLPKLVDPGSDAPEWERIHYCRRDVEILLKGILGYIDFCIAEDLGDWAVTLAGQSMNAFRHRFMLHEIMVDHRPEIVGLERRALFGGRTEAYQLGDVGEVAAADKVSMYPSVMKAEQYPVKVLWHSTTAPPSRLIDWLGRPGVGVVAEVTVHLSAPVAPKFEGDKLTFPVGVFRTVLTSPELRAVLTHGQILAVHDASFYRMAPIFTGFVEYWSSRRQDYKTEGNDLWALLCKNVQNSLYGKFGQRAPEWGEAEPPPEIAGLISEIGETGILCDDVAGWWRWFGSTFEKRVEVRGEVKYSIPAIAAFVTGYARQILWAEVIRPLGAQMMYTDTDSAYWKGALGDMGALIVSGKVLGMWNEEKGGPMEIRGLKDYSINGVGKTKGIRKNAKLVKPGEYQQVQFRSHVGAMRDGEPGVQRIRPITKRVKGWYNKGNVLSCGRVTPFVFDMERTEETVACPRCSCSSLAEYDEGRRSYIFVSPCAT